MIVTECRVRESSSPLWTPVGCPLAPESRQSFESHYFLLCEVLLCADSSLLYMLSCLFTSPMQNPDCGSQLTRQWRFCASASPWSDSSSTCVCQLVTLAPTLISTTLYIVDRTFYTAYDVNVCSYSNLRHTRLHAWASSLPWTVASWTALKLTGES